MQIRGKGSNLDLHVQSVASCRLDDPGACGRPTVAGARSSVEKHDVLHRTRALLGVHRDAMPARKLHRRMVRMTDRTLCEELGIADEPHPAAATPLLLVEPAITGVADPTRMATVHPDDVAAAPIRELEQVCLAPTAGQRLVAKHEPGRRIDLSRRDEEPLALADVGGVASTERILRPD